MLHIFALDQMLVHISLDLGKVTAHDLDQLGWQMLSVEGVDTTKDKIVDSTTHFVLDLHHFVLLCFRCIRFSTSQNGKERISSEFLWRSQNTGVGKAHHSVEFLQVCALAGKKVAS